MLRFTLLSSVLLCALLGAMTVVHAERTSFHRASCAARMRIAATALFESLGDDQREAALFAFDDEQRLKWNMRPGVQIGVSLAELSEGQRAMVHELLRAGLSAAGYHKLLAIIALEPVLFELESRPNRPANHRDALLYEVALFGEPNAETPWGWRFEGHHASLNFTIHGDVARGTPLFLGSNPTEVPIGDSAGLVALPGERDLAFDLLAEFEGEARATVIQSDLGEEGLWTNNGRAPTEPTGMASDAMDRVQRVRLARLYREYTDTLDPDLAAELRARVKESGAEAAFAWTGAPVPAGKHSYRVQDGPVLIEYATMGNPIHVHALLREAGEDLGVSLLAK